MAKLLLEKEVITRYALSYLLGPEILTALAHSEDMISLLGKRPFLNRADDMDKWLDEHRGGRSAPPPLEPSTSAEPVPAPAASKLEDELKN